MNDFNSLLMFDVNGNINVASIFTNSWFFGFVDIGFIFILFASALLLNRYGFGFGQIMGLIFAMSLGFATMTGSLIMWGIVIVIIVFSGLRMLQSILLRI